jgi:MarR family transcriptional regulator, organic hydroperoxide resistance regulator
MKRREAKRPPLRFLSPIHRVMRRVTDYLTGPAAELGLGTSEAHLISYLGSYAPCPIGDLVRVFGLKRSTLTSILDRLEGLALIRRTVHEGDRRSFMVDLTRSGAAASVRVRESVEALEARIAELVSAKNIAGFHAVLAAMEQATAPAQKE